MSVIIPDSFKPCNVDINKHSDYSVHTDIYDSWDEDENDNYPTHVNTFDQLILCPKKYRNDDPTRPLKLEDDGETYKYALNPTTYSVLFILLVELLERFSYYGVSNTQTAFLTGAYDKNWNVGMTSIEASFCSSRSTAMAYTAPFLGALLADCLLGDYSVILFGMLVLYIPGLALIVLTTVPNLVGDHFPRNMLRFAMLVLWPLGGGTIKSVVNIFGARQYHPKLQSSMIESYYVNFYMCINVGSLIGGIMVPIIAEHSVFIAYAIPLGALAFGVLMFLSCTPRYVRRRPQGDIKSYLGTLHALLRVTVGQSVVVDVAEEDQRVLMDKLSALPSKGTASTIAAVVPPALGRQASATSARQLMNIIHISFLCVAFNVCYAQMSTIFIVQGMVMEISAGFIDAPMMNNADVISVLVSGFIVGNVFYPYVARRKLKVYTTYKFALGSFFGALAIFFALVVEYRIHSVYEKTGQKISILWQTFSYVFIGIGEIFAISTAYEIAFAIAPKEQKALSSAINLFFTGGVPNYICMGLYRACQSWFINSRGDANIQNIEDYTQAHMAKYFWVLLIISLSGMILNLLPSIRDWVASVEEEAELMSNPVTVAQDVEKMSLNRTFTELTGKPSFLESTSGEESGTLLTSPPHHPSKTVLKAQKFILLNRHGSQYGSINKK